MPRHKYYAEGVAHLEGEVIQYRNLECQIGNPWDDWLPEQGMPPLDATNLEWRRKPKRFDGCGWVNVFVNGQGKEYLGQGVFRTREIATSPCYLDANYVRTIRMVESDA